MRVQVPFLAQARVIRAFVAFVEPGVKMLELPFVEGIAKSVSTSAVDGGIGAHTPFAVPGKGITLEVPTPADAPAIAAACQDPEIQKFTTVPVPYGPEHAEYFVNELTRQLWDEGGANWIIRVSDRSGSHVAGTVALRLGLEKTTNVGYWIAPEWRGRGLMTEALKLAVTTAFEKLGFECVVLEAHPENQGSLRVAWKCGFRFAGILRGVGLHQGKREDRAVASLLAGDPLEPVGTWNDLTGLLQRKYPSENSLGLGKEENNNE